MNDIPHVISKIREVRTIRIPYFERDCYMRHLFLQQRHQPKFKSLCFHFETTSSGHLIASQDSETNFEPPSSGFAAKALAQI